MNPKEVISIRKLGERGFQRDLHAVISQVGGIRLLGDFGPVDEVGRNLQTNDDIIGSEVLREFDFQLVIVGPN